VFKKFEFWHFLSKKSLRVEKISSCNIICD
jgi:hypothetical protein